MNKWQALQSFWASFGLPAYDQATVPTGEHRPQLPYITYEASVDSFDSAIALSASLWYYGTSWGPVTTKLSEIETAISRGGTLRPCDGGALWIKPGAPFAQRMSDPDDMIRRIVLNIEAEFITA